MRSFIFALLLLGFAGSLAAQGIRWIPFEDLADSLRVHPKPVMVFVYADWCKYCALQEHNTFGDVSLSLLIKEKYYAVRLNAEEKADIVFFNRRYRARSHDGHELVELLAASNGQVVLPTTVLLSGKFQVEGRFSGFVPPDQLRQKIGR